MPMQVKPHQTDNCVMVDYTPSADVAAGDVIVIGGIPHVAHRPIKANVLGALSIKGGIYLATVDQGASLAYGGKSYWQDTNNGMTETASGNTLFGTCLKAGGQGEIVPILHDPTRA